MGIEPTTSSLPRKCSTPELRWHKFYLSKITQHFRAGDEARTRDLQLGRLSLYQLSYSRNSKYKIINECCGGDRIRTYSGKPTDLQSAPSLPLRRTPSKSFTLTLFKEVRTPKFKD